MTTWTAWAPWLVLLLSIALAAALIGWARSRRKWKHAIKEVQSRAQSQATRHGQTTEQFAPFLHNWPWDAKDFRFIGSPIDGIQFHEDGIVIVEIKTGRSTLNARQRQARDHVQAGRVYWQEVRIA